MINLESQVRKPKDWASHHVPMTEFNEWLSLPGLEYRLKSEKVRHGLDEDGEIIIIAGNPSGDLQEIWFHPLAAKSFGTWYAEKVYDGNYDSLYGTVYAAFYDNGLVKVGMTYGSGGESRIASHDAVMALTKAKRIESFVIQCNTPSKRVEGRILRIMSRLYENRSAEWFYGAKPYDVKVIMEDCAEEDLHEWCRCAKVSI